VHSSWSGKCTCFLIGTSTTVTCPTLQNDLATFSLLNNNTSHQLNQTADFRLNAFKSCLLSSDLSSEESRCLVKLIATNLIASNFITGLLFQSTLSLILTSNSNMYILDGIQLLFLIDQGLDACKYLISQGLWDKALASSKVRITIYCFGHSHSDATC